jgi:hypothetical protein
MTTTHVVPAEKKNTGVAQVIHLGDCILLGSESTTQEYNWGSGDKACALSAAALGALTMGVNL